MCEFGEKEEWDICGDVGLFYADFNVGEKKAKEKKQKQVTGGEEKKQKLLTDGEEKIGEGEIEDGEENGDVLDLDNLDIPIEIKGESNTLSR